MLWMLLPAIAYAALLLYIRYAWRQLRVIEGGNGLQQPFFSIVIAARNESKSIGKCLESIQSMDYPADLFEVIVVDDHSRDDTAQVVKLYPWVQLLLLPEGRAGKKSALSHGIHRASGPWIATTDADCVVPPAWLRLHASAIEPDVVAVAGPVLFAPTDHALERFQALDFLGTMLVTGAGIGAKRWHLGNGANLVFSRAAFLAVGGYSRNAHHAGGDDVFLLEALAEKYPNGIRFLKHQDGVVWTPPMATLSDFVRQRVRWGIKNSALAEYSIRFIGGVVWLTCCWILGLTLLALAWPAYCWPAVMCWILKGLADGLVLAESARFFHQHKRLWFFLPAQPMHTMYIAAIGTWSMLFKRTTWKERSI